MSVGATVAEGEDRSEDTAARGPAVAAVTFDAGQTLIDLDPELLACRLAERGVSLAAPALAGAAPAAWQVYDAAVAAGAGHPWRVLMDALLTGAGLADAERRAPLVEWLWHEQPRKNLWRRRIPGMFELAGRLRKAGVAVAVLSNSEGRLAELFAEQGWAAEFPVIIDSGRVGVEKPDRRIFDLTLERLGVTAPHAVHIGDSWPADVAGALGAGLRAIWFGRLAGADASRGGGDDADPRVRRAADAAEVQRALVRWGVPL
jgi:FMN hydrolase / 5-amino-6-(5-phospho-D-ribitylamino)uracil phosphatase